MMSDNLKALAKRLLYPVPSHLAGRQIRIDDDRLDMIREAIKHNYHTGWRSEDNYSKELYETDLAAHLYKRLDGDRMRTIPWVSSARSLEGAKVLEVGCGTGASTVALAEQGASVTGIDVDEGALAVAKLRCELYGLQVELKQLNAIGIREEFSLAKFDFIIFFASLEHMMVEERLTALKNAWDMLDPGGLLVIIETPNRLWYFDRHTSRLPFFHWLPDELAFRYSRFSPQENFRELFRQYDATSRQDFLRMGRGMSFHEIDIAVGPASELNVVSSLSQFEGIRFSVRRTRMERRYKAMLRRACPSIHPGFFDRNLDLIIEKSHE